ncbi:MAG: Alkyl hydroperoxide reductase subunit C-like protein, partial [uncultured Sphingomonas sp.]
APPDPRRRPLPGAVQSRPCRSARRGEGARFPHHRRAGRQAFPPALGRAVEERARRALLLPQGLHPGLHAGGQGVQRRHAGVPQGRRPSGRHERGRSAHAQEVQRRGLPRRVSGRDRLAGADQGLRRHAAAVRHEQSHQLRHRAGRAGDLFPLRPRLEGARRQDAGGSASAEAL